MRAYGLFMNLLATAAISVNILLAIGSANAERIQLNSGDVSELPIHVREATKPRANIIAIVGGAGVRNKDGRSQNYLVKQAKTFAQSGITFYLFPNNDTQEKGGYSLRNSPARTERIHSLVEIIRKRNKEPIYIVGFSRGSVDAGRFAKTHPKSIEGIVIASGIFTNESRKARDYTMELIIGRHIEIPVLFVHHVTDACHVTPFKHAKLFFHALDAPAKEFLAYNGGGRTGRDCGPLNHHGFEGIGATVAQDISSWILRPK
ncbi:MAG: hypothetical protein CL573_00270 [Alphaproteobacteria bacterium]|nr:hypothetical protein [Alphaproteobacteria bacterium]